MITLSLGFLISLLMAGANSAKGQYLADDDGGAYTVDNSPANPTAEQTQECEDLGISISDCTENAILAKRSLLQSRDDVYRQDPITDWN